MAYSIKQRYGIGLEDRWNFPPGFVIYNTETTGALHRQLEKIPNYSCSEYFEPEHASGDRVDGRLHEDLQELSFEDDSIDLVLSSDVLEHVPKPYDAHAEILRVLKAGVRHIFTVPYDSRLPVDQVRARIVHGEMVYLEEKEFHGDPLNPDKGVLVWPIFGGDMLNRLQDLGFDAAMQTFDCPEHGIIGGGVTFEARKPLENSPEAQL